MRLWQQRQEEHEARLDAIRARVEDSANSGESIPLVDAFDQIEQRHRERMQPCSAINETIRRRHHAGRIE